MLRLAVVALTVALLTVASACQSSPNFDQPPEILYGEDICDQCNMIISEPRYAAAYVAADGNIRRFDDIGDMLVYHDKHAEDVAMFWVHDYDSEEWIGANDALFVISGDLTTPMAHGLIAFLDHERAQTMAKEFRGEVIQFDQLLFMDVEEGLPLHSQSEHLNQSAASDGEPAASQDDSTGSIDHSQDAN